MTDEDKRRLVDRGIADLVMACKINKVDFMSLPMPMKQSLVEAYRLGADSMYQEMIKTWDETKNKITQEMLAKQNG